MTFRSRLLGVLSLFLALSALQAQAGATDPLFINLTSDDPHRAKMAITFGGKQQERGHPLTIFLNDKAVLVGSKAGATQFAEQQKALQSLMDAGAKVLICPMCMKHYGVTEADLIPGLQIGSPERTGEALFQDGGRTLSW